MIFSGSSAMKKDYSQPKEYHFSEISIAFVKNVRTYLDSINFKANFICDAYAGCGVVGLEYLAQSREQAKIDFIELQQDVFSLHLERNIQWKQANAEVFFISIAKFTKQVQRRYDLILANPPYYDPKRVRTSPNKVKALAHSFFEGSIQDLFLLVHHCLHKNGYCFFLFPKDHFEDQYRSQLLNLGLSLMEVKELSPGISLFLLSHLNKN